MKPRRGREFEENTGAPKGCVCGADVLLLLFRLYVHYLWKNINKICSLSYPGYDYLEF